MLDQFVSLTLCHSTSKRVVFGIEQLFALCILDICKASVIFTADLLLGEENRLVQGAGMFSSN